MKCTKNLKIQSHQLLSWFHEPLELFELLNIESKIR